MPEENEGLVGSAYEAYGRGGVHTPGADQHRAWRGNDRNYLVLTLRQGQVVAMRAYRDRDGARGSTSEDG
jgi:hypothetical protein